MIPERLGDDLAAVFHTMKEPLLVPQRPAMLIALIVGACSPSADRRQQLVNCEAIAKSGEDVRSCLILKYDWNADSAVPAGARFQWRMDSLRREHEAQAAAVVAAAAARAESLRIAKEVAGARRAAPWVSCILRQWRAGKLGANVPSFPPRPLYEPCWSVEPSHEDYSAYAALHHLDGDTAELLGGAIGHREEDRALERRLPPQ